LPIAGCQASNTFHQWILDKYRFGAREIVTRSDLATFLESLFDFEVGALLHPGLPQHQWLIGKVRSKVAAQPGADMGILDTFIAEATQRVPDDPIGFNGLSVLVIGKLNEA
jgi:hypothetical protein